jgi:hypothetical protein
VHEDLLNAVSNLVHRHVLRELHDMTGALLAQLDAGDVPISFNERDPPAPVKLPHASTIARKERRWHAQQRQAVATAATGAAAPVTAAPAGHWPVLRTEFHAAIKARHLSRAKVAAELDVSKGSICGWLLPHGAPPSAANIDKIRGWLDKPVPASGAVHQCAEGGDWPALRERLRAVVRERALTHAEIGAVLGVEGATVGGWLAPSHEQRSRSFSGVVVGRFSRVVCRLDRTLEDFLLRMSSRSRHA